MEIITAKPNTVGTLSTMSVLIFHRGEVWQLEEQVCPFRRMFKIVFKQHSIFVQRFAQKAFANPSSFYGRKMSSFTNGSSKTPIQQWRLWIRVLKFAFSKLANFHCWSLAARGRNCQWQLFALNPAVFFWDMGATQRLWKAWQTV